MINEINVKEYAKLAIQCIEALKYTKLTEQEKYLIGREIEKHFRGLLGGAAEDE